MPDIPHRGWARRAVPAAAVAALVIAGTAAVRTNASASATDTYRMATVTKGSVEQRLDLTGSVQRVNQVSQGFAVSGTVSSVSVAVGDAVRAGQTLATLDPKPFNSALTNAKAALAQAKATLESDQSTTTATTAATTSTGSTTASQAASTQASTTTPRVASPSARTGAGANQSLPAAQQRVKRAQGAITSDLGRATSALSQCAAFFPSAPSSSGPTDAPPGAVASPPAAAAPPAPPAAMGQGAGGPTTPPTTPATTPATPTSAPTDAEIAACLGALRTAPSQQQIQRDQQELITSQADLTKAFTLLITTAGNTATSPTSQSGSTNQTVAVQSSTSRSGSASQSGQNSAAGQSSAVLVASDQASVTSAQASLSSAETDRTSATLKSSIAGKVGSVSLVNGTSSQGKSIVIVGAGAAEVTVNVPLASMAHVQVGQKAVVTPQCATSSVPGSVTSISLLPSASGTGSGTGSAQPTTTASSPTYPVVVLVPDALPALASGARARASLLIGAVSDVLTVPNSALTPLADGQALALTMKNGVGTRALVKTGYAGTFTTQISSGLSAGQQVVLADLSTALPSNTTNARRFGVGGGGIGGATGISGAGLNGGSFTGPSGFRPGG
ncbi:MAG: biotin/lipoyl-binding protein [Dermatophilaceae bacterium]